MPARQRLCPKCEQVMEKKGAVQVYEEADGHTSESTALYQCPVCRNVEILDVEPWTP